MTRRLMSNVLNKYSELREEQDDKTEDRQKDHEGMLDDEEEALVVVVDEANKNRLG